MTLPRTALLLAALAFGPASLPACAGTGSAAPSAPAAQPDAAQAAAAKTAADNAAADQAAADKAAAARAVAERVAAQKAAAEKAAAVKAAAEKAAAEQRAAAERAAAEAQMRRAKEAAEAAAAAVQAKAELEQRAARPAPLEVGKGKTAEQIAAQNAAAIELAGEAAGQPATIAPAAPAAPPEDFTRLVAEIQTSKGSLVLEFFPDVAPRHVQNFVDLARKGFYDGQKFHRIIPGFLVQAGDPKGDGTGGNDGTDRKLAAEWSERPHRRGTLSMARLSHPDSAGSQFFICHQEQAGYDLATLDGRYTVFGQLIRGFGVLDSIATVGGPSGEPKETVTMLKVIIRPRQGGDHEPGA